MEGGTEGEREDEGGTAGGVVYVVNRLVEIAAFWLEMLEPVKLGVGRGHLFLCLVKLPPPPLLSVQQTLSTAPAANQTTGNRPGVQTASGSAQHHISLSLKTRSW